MKYPDRDYVIQGPLISSPWVSYTKEQAETFFEMAKEGIFYTPQDEAEDPWSDWIDLGGEG